MLRPVEESTGKQHITVAIWGGPKAGKSLTALRIAKGLANGERFAVLDTERNGMLMYRHYGGFDVDTDMVDFSPKSYLAWIAQYDGKYPVLVIDSLTHEWQGKGGVLEIADRVGKSNQGSPFGGWKIASPMHTEFIDALLQCRSHLICTMRSRTQWEIITNDKGKKQPVEVGTEAIQRDGTTYEFDLLLTIDTPGTAHLRVHGSRLYCADGSNLFAPGYEANMVGEEFGQQLRDWLHSEGGNRMAILAEAAMRKFGPEKAQLLLASVTDPDQLQQILDSRG